MLVKGRVILGSFPGIDLVDSPLLDKEFEVLRVLKEFTDQVLENEVIIMDAPLQGIKGHNCIVIYNTGRLKSWASEDNIYLEVSTFSNDLIKHLIDLGVNVPADIDENSLIYRYNPVSASKLERILFTDKENRNLEYLGRCCSIGVTGDVVTSSGTLLGIGAVKIGKNVHIGNNVVIYRGTTGLTIINDNTWICDNAIIHHDAEVSGYVGPFSENR